MEAAYTDETNIYAFQSCNKSNNNRTYRVTLLHKWLVVPVANPLFVPVLEPGQGFRDKSLEAFVPGGRTGTKGA